MKTPKPRCDATLKKLPASRQAEIFDYAAEHGLVKCAAWLREDGLQTSKSAVGEFCLWFGLQQQLRQNESTVAQALEDMKRNDPTLSQGQLDQAGNLFFSALAIQEKDSLMWKRTKDAQTKQEVVRQNNVKLMRETCELFLQWVEDKRAKEIATSSSSNSDKIAQLGQLMFGEDWDRSPVRPS